VEIDIFVGDLGSTAASKELAVGIPFPSVGCGRSAQHISFTDTQNRNEVGQVKEYGIHAIQMKNGKQHLSNMTLAPYRIPFFVAVDGVVETLTSNGVEGVRIDFCHIDATTGLEDTNPDFCPLITLYSDKRGHFEGEIRVSDPSWTNLVEYFNVTATLTEEIVLEDGTSMTVVHDFTPASSTVAMQHKSARSSLRIVDNTAVTLRGSVMIDPNSVGGHNCSFQGVTVELVDSKGIVDSTISAEDGSFTFSLSRGEAVTVRIPEFRGHTWSAALLTLNSGSSGDDTATTGASSVRRLLHVEQDEDILRRRSLANSGSGVTDLLTGAPLASDYWMETGSVVAGDQEWVSVTTTERFSGDFQIFMSTPNFHPSDERFMVSARVRNIRQLGGLVYFETKLLQANDSFCSKQWHIPQPITPTELSWLVVESGAFELSNNIFFVGARDVTQVKRNLKARQNLFTAYYPSGLTFAPRTEVGVIAQVQTLNNKNLLLVPRVATVSEGFVVLTISPPTPTNLSLYDTIVSETVAYMAYSFSNPMECSEFWSLEPQVLFITDTKKSIKFGGKFAVTPSVFGLTTVDFAAQDTANLRVESVTVSGASVMLQEDQCRNYQTTATLGRVYMLVMGQNHNPTGNLECGIKSKVVLPSVAPTRAPTLAPTSPSNAPSSVPSGVPSYSPSSSMPSIAPSSSPPTSVPSAAPSISAMPTVTFAPTGTPPTVAITTKNGTQVLMAFNFDSTTVKKGSNVVTDSVNGLEATLHGVTVSNGDAVFTPSSGPVPYIQLPVAPLGRISVATIEIWASFNKDHDPLSTLFSFGPAIDAVHLMADFTGERSVYIAVVFDTEAGEYKLYKNANLVETGVFGSAFVFSNLRVNDNMGFLGRGPTDASSHGMSATVHDFRVTYGALSRKAIYSQYRVGGNPDVIKLPGKDTMADIDLAFYATTKQFVEIGMYGGTSHAGGQRIGGLEMFGPETKFRFQATDYSCDYSFDVALHRDGSPIQLNLAAINYSVTLFESAGSAPRYTDDAVNLFQPSSPFFCDDSKTPLQYFSDAGMLNQTIEIVTPSDSYKQYNYTYMSGVCLAVAGSDDFSFDSGLLDMVVGESCFDEDATIIREGSSVDVTIYMYERYPVENHWLDSHAYMVDSPDDEYTSYDIEPFVEDTTLTIYDLVGGFNSPQVMDYDDTVDYAGPLSRVRTPKGNRYKILASDPLPSLPHSWKFRVVGSRAGADGFSTAEATWYIPVTGVLGKEVPNLYPVASDPNLIFMVLRDPPGGGSFSTIHAGKI
jgi:hypothetical protein